ncbi:MAG: PilZ domain-containing protein [Bdellovibrionaceae bacterium]|nr:PilZ domain-containing protein [Pseudobdellovibrionaceae bacterium]
MLKVHDISVGGCCLLDSTEILGPSVGNDVHLVLRWPDGPVSVHGRIVSRVDHKRHIQFLNLPTARMEELKKAIAPAALGFNVRPTMKTVEHGPTIQAREMWSSLQGDTVIIEDHVHRLAHITLNGIQFTLYKHAWPVKDVSTPLTRIELAHLILFLCNIPQPSELLSALIAHVETMSPPEAQ